MGTVCRWVAYLRGSRWGRVSSHRPIGSATYLEGWELGSWVDSLPDSCRECVQGGMVFCSCHWYRVDLGLLADPGGRQIHTLTPKGHPTDDWPTSSRLALGGADAGLLLVTYCGQGGMHKPWAGNLLACSG